MEQSHYHSPTFRPRRGRHVRTGSSTSDQLPRTEKYSPIQSRARASSISLDSVHTSSSHSSFHTYLTHAKTKPPTPRRTPKSEPLYLEDLGPKYSNLRLVSYTGGLSSYSSKMRLQDASVGADVPPTFYDKMLSLMSLTDSTPKPSTPPKRDGKESSAVKPRRKRDLWKKAVLPGKVSKALQLVFLVTVWSVRKLVLDATVPTWESLSPVGVASALMACEIYRLRKVKAAVKEGTT